MKKSQLAARLAKETGIPKAAAADQLDHVVHQIISRLRNGETARLPGLGKFTPGTKWKFQFERKKRKLGT